MTFLFIFVLVSVVQLTICLERNKTDDDELPDWQTLWQNSNLSVTRRTRKPRDVTPKPNRLRLYQNLTSVMEVIERAKVESVYRSEATNVLRSYDEDCMKDPDHQSTSPSVRKPYVILEADFISRKRFVVSKVAKKMGALNMRNPPGCLFAYRRVFPYTNTLRAAYFALGEYAISYNVTLQWDRHPILFSGSWAERTSYLVCRAFRKNDMPPFDNEVYVWPKDLLQPHILVFLHNVSHVKDIPTTSRHYYRFKLLEWYTKLQGPLVTVVYTDDFNTTDALVDNVISVIKDKVRNYTDVSGIPIQKVRNTRRPKGSPTRTYTPKIRYLRTYKPTKRHLRTYKPRTTTFPPASNDSVVSSTLPAIDSTAVISVTKHTLTPDSGYVRDDSQPLGHMKYTSLASILDEFRNGNLSKTPLADLVLAHYENQCYCANGIPPIFRRKVYVAVESNSISTRQILAARFAKHLGGDVYRVLPRCITRVRSYFKHSHPLLDAFYLLGVYITTIQMSKRLVKDPVIITGSWIDKAAHMIARRYRQELPPPESDVYKLAPKDLLMPDIIFYAFFADDVHRTPETTRPPYAWKHRVTEIYQRMEGPPVFILNCKSGFDGMVREMINHTLNTLSNTYDLRNLWPYWDQLRQPKLS